MSSSCATSRKRGDSTRATGPTDVTSSIAATRGTAATGGAPALRRLYLVRFGFALVWAILLFLTASNSSPLTAVLLVLYPVFDVAAAVVDVRAQRGGAARTGSAVGLVATITVSTLAAVGLAVALTSGIPAALRVWGAWAIVAGVLQLVVAVGRRRLGGQWVMIISGALSVVAGTTLVFVVSTHSIFAGNLISQPGSTASPSRSARYLALPAESLML